MSVTFSLMNVKKDVEYVGHFLDKYKLSELTIDTIDALEIANGRPTSGEPVEFANKLEEWENEVRRNCWSDKKEHYFLDLTYHKSCFRGKRGWRTVEKQISMLPVKKFVQNRITKKYISCDVVDDYCGWFLKNSFFKKDVTFSILTTKRDVQNFFKKYSSDIEISNIVTKNIFSKWTDDSILVVSW